MKAIGAAVFMTGVFVASSAYAQKVIIVKDGTVDAITQHGLPHKEGLGNKESDEQKFKFKTKFVELLYGPQTNACTTQWKPPAEFKGVRFQVRLTARFKADQAKRPEGLDKFPITAKNRGFIFKHLTLGLPPKTLFAFKLTSQTENKYQLTDNNDNATTDRFELEDIEVEYDDGTFFTASRDDAHPSLCARFIEKD